MITIEQLHQADPAAAEAVANLRAAAMSAHSGQVSNDQWHRAAALLGRRCATLLQKEGRDSATIKQYRYAFNRAVWGGETGSTLEMDSDEIHAMQEWLTGNPQMYERIITAVMGITEEQQEETDMAGHMEAKVIDWFKMNSPAGVAHSFTVREGGTGDMAEAVITTALTLEKRLLAKGWTPYGKAPSSPAPQQQAPPPQQQQQGNGQEGWCPIHNMMMTQRSNANGSWWSHKVGDAWCKGS
jgi:hypothetical protein